MYSGRAHPGTGKKPVMSLVHPGTRKRHATPRGHHGKNHVYKLHYGEMFVNLHVYKTIMTPGIGVTSAMPRTSRGRTETENLIRQLMMQQQGRDS